VSERIGPFQLGPAQAQWGSGWFAASPTSLEDDDLPPSLLLHVSSPGEGLALALEGAWRGKYPHACMPRLLRRGEDAGRTWLAFQREVAVPLDLVLDADQPVAVELALAWCLELVDVMAHHGAHLPPNAAQDADRRPVREPLRPSFADLLVTERGSLLVVTTPAAGRVQRPGLLRQPARDRELLAPELVAGERADAERVDTYVAGALLRALLHDHVAREDVSSHVSTLIARATAHSEERFESLHEVASALRAALDEQAPLEPDERAAFMKQRADTELERARRSFSR
jgi:hypothetical protein